MLEWIFTVINCTKDKNSSFSIPYSTMTCFLWHLFPYHTYSITAKITLSSLNNYHSQDFYYITGYSIIVRVGGLVVKASDPVTVLIGSGVRFPTVTICRRPRQASYKTLPLFVKVMVNVTNYMIVVLGHL